MGRYVGEQHAEYELARYHARRAEAVELLGGHCVKCGTTDSLEIDHIDPADKSFEIGKLWSVSRPRYLAELVKCQLLCTTHHREKSRAAYPEQAHGRWRYLSKRNRCRCDICVTDVALYRKERRRLKNGRSVDAH